MKSVYFEDSLWQLLQLLQQPEQPEQELLPFLRLLTEVKIIAKRIEYINKLNIIAKDFHSGISSGKEKKDKWP